MTKSTRGRSEDGAPNPIDVHVGRRIRLRRTLLGMSQDRLGEAIGLTFQQVQKYERGANRIGASRMFDLSRVLDVPISFFFDDMDDATAAASPAQVAAGAVTAFPVSDPDPETTRESLELMRAYWRIADPVVRKQIYELVKSLGQEIEAGLDKAA